MSDFVQALIGAGIPIVIVAAWLGVVWWWTKYPPIPNDADHEIR